MTRSSDARYWIGWSWWTRNKKDNERQVEINKLELDFRKQRMGE